MATRLAAATWLVFFLATVPAPALAQAARLSQAITFSSFPTAATTYSTFTFEASASSGLPLAFASSGVCTLLDAPPPTPANTVFVGGSTGNCTITATQAGDDVYEPATASATVPVGRLQLQARLSGVPAAAAYGTSFSASASTTFSIYVPIIIVEGDCTASAPSSVVTVTMADSSGACLITAFHPGSDSVEVLPVTVAVAATKRAVAVTAVPHWKFRGDEDPQLLYGITSGGLVQGDTFSGMPVREPGETPGTYGITQGTLALGPHYAMAWTDAPLTILDPATFRLAGKVNYPSKAGSFRDNPALAGMVSLAFDVSLGAAATPAGSVSLTLGSVGLQSTALHSVEAVGVYFRILGWGVDTAGSPYAFMVAIRKLSGWPGQVRVMVWDDTGVVYDTAPGKPPAGLPELLLYSGSILISP